MDQSCCVCGGLLDSDDMFRCNMCGGSFHMAWSVNAPVSSCGHYWVNKQLCGLVFTCADCEERLTDPENRSVP